MPKALIAYDPDPRTLYKLLRRHQGSVLAVIVVLRDGDGRRLGPVVRELKQKLGAEQYALVVINKG